MNTRVNRVFSGLDETASILAAGTTLYNTTTGAINLSDRELGLFDSATLTSLDPSTALTIIKYDGFEHTIPPIM